MGATAGMLYLQRYLALGHLASWIRLAMVYGGSGTLPLLPDYVHRISAFLASVASRNTIERQIAIRIIAASVRYKDSGRSFSSGVWVIGYMRVGRASTSSPTSSRLGRFARYSGHDRYEHIQDCDRDSVFVVIRTFAAWTSGHVMASAPCGSQSLRRLRSVRILPST